jgi:hypothetical protein
MSVKHENNIFTIKMTAKKKTALTRTAYFIKIISRQHSALSNITVVSLPPHEFAQAFKMVVVTARNSNVHCRHGL